MYKIVRNRISGKKLKDFINLLNNEEKIKEKIKKIIDEVILFANSFDFYD